MADPLEEIRALTRMDELPSTGGQAVTGRRGADRVKPDAAAKRSGLLPLLGMLGAIGLLWTTPVVYPLRLLVVFFHELSHALMALLTGGQVLRIELSALEGGVAYTAGGNGFLIASAGYLGSLVWGGAILWAAIHWRGGRILTGLLGALLLGVCLIWVRPLWGFGVPFCLLAGAALLWASRKLSHDANDLTLKLIGLTSLMYVPLDIVDDIILRSGLVSDARLLAQMTFIPTIVWGVLWGGLSVVMAWWFLKEAGKNKA